MEIHQVFIRVLLFSFELLGTYSRALKHEMHPNIQLLLPVFRNLLNLSLMYLESE